MGWPEPDGRRTDVMRGGRADEERPDVMGGTEPGEDPDTLT
jgi:hypothetical protein